MKPLPLIIGICLSVAVGWILRPIPDEPEAEPEWCYYNTVEAKNERLATIPVSPVQVEVNGRKYIIRSKCKP